MSQFRYPEGWVSVRFQVINWYGLIAVKFVFMGIMYYHKSNIKNLCKLLESSVVISYLASTLITHRTYGSGHQFFNWLYVIYIELNLQETALCLSNLPLNHWNRCYHQLSINISLLWYHVVHFWLEASYSFQYANQNMQMKFPIHHVTLGNCMNVNHLLKIYNTSSSTTAKNLQCEKQLEYFTINCQSKEEYYIEDPSEHTFKETVSFTIGNFIFINIMHDCKG